MLCQLVCVDRRYQRMNCFNIRELQGILKRKFFTDLVNSNDHRDLFDKSIIGLRFKNNNQLNVNHDMSLFYNFGTTTSAKTKHTLFNNNYLGLNNLTTTHHAMNNLFVDLSGYVIRVFNALLSTSFLGTTKLPELGTLVFSNFNSNISSTLKEVLNTITAVTLITLTSATNLPKFVNEFLVMNFSVNFYNITDQTILQTAVTDNGTGSTLFTSENITNLDSLQTFNSSASEISTSLRFTRFNNPLISYDYKCGNYLGIWDQLYPSLMTSFIEVARGIRKAP
jgi:hypothetical protein